MLTTTASILIGDSSWLWPAILSLLVGLAAMAWGYAAARGQRGVIAPAVLKGLGFAALAFFLLNPLWVRQRAQPRANLFITLSDNSASMNVTDEDEDDSRAAMLRKSLTGDDGDGSSQVKENEDAEGDRSDKTLVVATPRAAKWAMKLDEQFDARHYAFDARMSRLDAFTSLTFDGSTSALVSALHALRDRFTDRPVAGILLFTDGNATDITADALRLAGLPPIYPVLIGEDQPARDIGVTHVAVSQTAFEDAPVTITADVRASGHEDETIAAYLYDTEGNVIEKQTRAVKKDDETTAFHFQLRPTESGVAFYRLLVQRQDEDAPGIDPKTDEATPANNEHTFVVDRGRGPYRVLYVSGRPNWEFKFLNRALAEDPQVHVVGLIRIARREPRFAWRSGRDGDRSNPFFRGTDQKDDEVEEYDQPVLVRFNTEDENELRDGFPKTAETLFGYHAVILDDVESEFFTRDQLALIERFVTQRRGGLMMLGGAESLGKGGYKDTPLGRMLPVYLDARTGGTGGTNQATPQPPLRFELTRDGQHEKWTRLRSTEAEEIKRLAAMPDYLTINEVSGIKPGATVLAHAKDANGIDWPALVTQPFGGRVAVVTIGDHWRWALKRDENHADEPGKMWRQTLRWLVADVPPRVGVQIEPLREEPSSPLSIRVAVHDERFDAVDNAAVRVKVHPPEGDPIELTAEPMLGAPGIYETTYLPRLPGAYRVEAAVADMQGKPIGKADAGFAHQPATEEFRTLRPNRALLEAIAKQTGGELVELDDLEDFVSELPQRDAPVMELSVDPLWHQWWAFAAALACFIGEWGLRRVRGLP